jgi:PKD repeat protein
MLALTTAAAPAMGASIYEVRVANVRDTAFAVSWLTDGDATGSVLYGTDPASLAQTAHDFRGAGTSDDTHYVIVDQLAPLTLYYFDIVSGSSVDDNGGAHHTVTTGPTLDPPGVDTIHGKVLKADGTTGAEGSIVYFTLRDADGSGSPGDSAPLSALAEAGGYWSTGLGSARTSDLADHFDYHSSLDEVELSVAGGADGTATLTVDTGNDSPAPDIVLTEPISPTANFAANPTRGVAPLTVTFTNTSQGDYWENLWHLGDGTTTTLASPTHTYTTPNAYTVTLFVHGLGGSDAITRSNYLSVCHRSDVACDCKIDVADIQAVASGWRCSDGDGCYDAAYDFDGDDTITVVDIMQVAARWGCACGDPCYGGGTTSAALLSTKALAATEPALVSVEPLSLTVAPGETFSVSAVITDVGNLGAFQFELGYDPSVVQVDDAALGPFLGSTGRNVSPLGPTIDNSGGKLTFGAFSFGTQPGPSGCGVLSTIEMTAGLLGATPLDLDEVQVLYPSGTSQAVTVEDGKVSLAGTRYLYLPLIIMQ